MFKKPSRYPAVVSMTDAQRTSVVRRIFSTAHPTYDFLNHFLSLRRDVGWRRRTVERMRFRRTSRFLDIATGTADLAIEAALAHGEIRVTGIDFAEPMLAIGRQKVARCGLSGRVDLVAGDALQLPFADEVFDVTAIAFGMRNIPDKARALREMTRVTVPGGQIMVLEMAFAPAPAFKGIYGLYLRRLLPLVARLAVRDASPYYYLADSIMRFPLPEAFDALMRDAGLVAVRHHALTFGAAYLHVGRKPFDASGGTKMDLAHIFEPVREELALVEQELKTVMARVADVAGPDSPGLSRLGILSRIVQHPFAVPGKRIRPAMVLLSSLSADGKRPRESLIRLAAAVEVLHAASLVHDDIIDRADQRRHQVSLNKRYGDRVAVLAGDILYTHFFSLITDLPSVSLETRFVLLELFLKTTKEMCMGEILAQEVGGRGGLSFEDYLEISSDKTASLFSACCETAGLVCGMDKGTVGLLRDFGMAFGLAFQMADDLVDGDHGLDAGVPLEQKTREYARMASDLAGRLPEGSCRGRLSELTEYVIRQATGVS